MDIKLIRKLLSGDYDTDDGGRQPANREERRILARAAAEAINAWVTFDQTTQIDGDDQCQGWYLMTEEDALAQSLLASALAVGATDSVRIRWQQSGKWRNGDA